MQGARVRSPSLAVLIPTFNWDVRQLLSELQREVLEAGIAAQIQLRLFDDGSAYSYREMLRSWWDSELKPGWDAQLVDLGRNVGRAEARNQLIASSTADRLLFLDADVLPDRPDFLQSYLATAASGAEVVVGGLSQSRVQDIAPDQAFYFRYFQSASCLPAERRQRRAWQHLYTSNVLVSRRLVQACPLSTSFVGYGYEDVEWALRLSRLVDIHHIDNTVSHCGLLSRSVLWSKQREASRNAVAFLRLQPEVAGEMALLRWATKFRRLPSWSLRVVAGAASALFLHCRSYRLSYVALQFEKLASTALEMKRAQTRRDQ